MTMNTIMNILDFNYDLTLISFGQKTEYGKWKLVDCLK